MSVTDYILLMCIPLLFYKINLVLFNICTLELSNISSPVHVHTCTLVKMEKISTGYKERAYNFFQILRRREYIAVPKH